MLCDIGFRSTLKIMDQLNNEIQKKICMDIDETTKY